MAATKTTKVTPAQAEVLAKAVRMVVQAQTMDFETWFMRSNYMSGEGNVRYGVFLATFEEAVEDHFRFFAKRDHRHNQEAYINEQVEDARREYEEHRKGIVYAHTSSNTLRALEKKGLIEIIKDGRRNLDTIRLLYI